MLDTTTGAGSRADRRLHEEGIIWLTTVRPDGQPQSVPVWFLWDGETFLIYSQPGQQKLKNISRNPRVGLHLNSNARGGDVVRAEGMAEVVEGVPPAIPQAARRLADGRRRHAARSERSTDHPERLRVGTHGGDRWR
jgi:PPOX class probable F420-dependent enzyme